MKKIFLLFLTFFKIGAFTFGGGFVMIPLIEREIVERKKWISQSNMIDIIAISQSFPGAVAINSAIFIGKRVGGYAGTISALLGVVTPSFLIITGVAKMFSYIWNLNIVQAAFVGINSAVVALLLTVAIRIGRKSIKDKITPFIAVAALAVLLFTNVHPIFIILAGIIIGIIRYFYAKGKGKIL